MSNPTSSSASPSTAPKPWTVKYEITTPSRIITLDLPYYWITPVAQDAPEGPCPVLVDPTMPKTVLKLQEAAYHQRKLVPLLHNELLLRFELSAFLSALKSIVDTLAKECGKSPGFRAWFKPRKDALLQDPLLEVVFAIRDKAVHEGDLVPEIDFATMLRYRKDGQLDAGVISRGFSLAGTTFTLPQTSQALFKVFDLVGEAGKASHLVLPVRSRNIRFNLVSVKEREDGTWFFFDEGKPDGGDVDDATRHAMERAQFSAAPAAPEK